MSQSIVLKSFAELAEALDLNALTAAPSEDAEVSPPTGPSFTEVRDLGELLADLQSAGATLATVARQDQEARARALIDLGEYDQLAASKAEADDVGQRAHQIRSEATAFVEDAFADEARTAAQQIVNHAAQVEATAARISEELNEEIQALAARLDIERLLAARRKQEAAEKAKAAEAEQARRLSGALAQAKEALAAGRIEEAFAVLEPLTKDNSDNAELASLMTIIARRQLDVKISAAEDALWLARREYRRDPSTAVAQLAALDVDGLPDPLGQQVFGEWARACARLCRERNVAEPLRYAPDPGHGAVIAREPDGRYVVVSALGMPAGWEPGSVVGERQARRARRLR